MELCYYSICKGLPVLAQDIYSADGLWYGNRINIRFLPGPAIYPAADLEALAGTYEHLTVLVGTG